LLIAFLSVGVFKLEKTKKDMISNLNNLKNDVQNLKNENKELKAKIKYLENPYNLIKEVKKQTNYKNEGENVIIITPGVPSEESKSTSSTSTP
jgi:cell division protein FtsB